jgi:hypothetical protein
LAGIRGIHSVGDSIVTYLRNAYPPESAGVALPACQFELVTGADFVGELDEGTRITLWLHRITSDEHARHMRRPGVPADGPAPLSLDLHYLLTAWAGNAQDEQITMAWAMRQLHLVPVFDLALLSPAGGWGRDESVQIVPEELPTADMMRVWDALDASYRLSAGYVARVVRLDPDRDDALFAPVVATRSALGREATP